MKFLLLQFLLCYQRIPIAHLHGGEATEGLIDEPIEHSISKMSHLHLLLLKNIKIE